MPFVYYFLSLVWWQARKRTGTQYVQQMLRYGWRYVLKGTSHNENQDNNSFYAQLITDCCVWTTTFFHAVKLLPPYYVSVAFCFQGQIAANGDLQTGNVVLHTPFIKENLSLQSYYATKECPLAKQDLNGCMLQSEDILPVGVWQHWTFTYDGKVQRIYVNGHATSSTTPPPGAMQTSAYPLNLGITMNTADGDASPGIKFSAVRLYQYALAPADIQSIANANVSAGDKIPIQVVKQLYHPVYMCVCSL